MIVRFICGCEHDVFNREFPMELEIENDYWPTDDEGLVICSAHKQRRYGWASIGRNHSLASLTPFEVEQRVVFGVFHPPREVHVTPPTSPNMRDNRDPVTVYKQMRLG